MSTVTLQSLASTDREQFIKDNQEAFNYGALEEFGLRDDHFEEEGQIISHDTIEQSIDSGEAYRILSDGDIVGGAVIIVDGKHGDLELLFIKPNVHSKASAMPHGARSRSSIRKSRFGRHLRHTSRKGTFTSMSTAVDFISWNI